MIIKIYVIINRNDKIRGYPSKLVTYMFKNTCMKFHAFIRSVTIQLKIGHKGLDYCLHVIESNIAKKYCKIPQQNQTCGFRFNAASYFGEAACILFL